MTFMERAYPPMLDCVVTTGLVVNRELIQTSRNVFSGGIHVTLTRTFVAALAVLALVFTACAEDQPAAQQTTTTAALDTTMAPMDDMDDMEGEGHDHDHEDAAATEWVGAMPQLTVRIEDGEDGKVAVLDATGFEFSEPTRTEFEAGVGHTHVYIDGRLLTMSYDPEVALGDLEPGMHHIEVTLAANDHSDYTMNGEIIGASAMVEIEGEVAPADVTIDIAFNAGEVSVDDRRVDVPLGSVVDLVITSDVADELHVHGYDVRVVVAAGETATLRFTADIPGIFEVELEESGAPALDLQVS